MENLLFTQTHTHTHKGVRMRKQTPAELKPSYIHCCYLAKGLVQRESGKESACEEGGSEVGVGD